MVVPTQCLWQSKDVLMYEEYTYVGLVGIPSSTFTHLHLIIFGKCIGEGISTIEIPSSWTNLIDIFQKMETDVG